MNEYNAIYGWRHVPDRSKPKSWQWIAAELEISTPRLRAERQTRGYLEGGYTFLTRFGYTPSPAALRQLGCLHPDTERLPMPPQAYRSPGVTQQRALANAGVVYDDGGRVARDMLKFGNSPDVRGDCGVRAIAIALEMDYDTVARELAEMQAGVYPNVHIDSGVALSVLRKYLTDRDWQYVIYTGMPSSVLRAFKTETVILKQLRHFVAGVNGQLHDIQETLRDSVYGIWVSNESLNLATLTALFPTQARRNTDGDKFDDKRRSVLCQGHCVSAEIH